MQIDKVEINLDRLRRQNLSSKDVTECAPGGGEPEPEPERELIGFGFGLWTDALTRAGGF